MFVHWSTRALLLVCATAALVDVDIGNGSVRPLSPRTFQFTISGEI